MLARIPEEELDALLRGYGYEPRYVTGHEPAVMHQEMAAALDETHRPDPGHPGRGQDGAARARAGQHGAGR